MTEPEMMALVEKHMEEFGVGLLPAQDDGGMAVEVREVDGELQRRICWRGEWSEWGKIR